jgi:hypothetical protein
VKLRLYLSKPLFLEEGAVFLYIAAFRLSVGRLEKIGRESQKIGF